MLPCSVIVNGNEDKSVQMLAFPQVFVVGILLKS